MRTAVFLDKDGTLVENVPYNVDASRLRLMPGAMEALETLSASGYALVVVSNQSGVARGLFPEQALHRLEQRLRAMLADGGVRLDGFYYCPHHPEGTVADYALRCECRKPEPGLLLRAAQDLGIDLEASYLIGDILDDIEAGRRAGCRTILVDCGNETEWRVNEQRAPHQIVRDLREAAAMIVNETSGVTIWK